MYALHLRRLERYGDIDQDLARELALQREERLLVRRVRHAEHDELGVTARARVVRTLHGMTVGAQARCVLLGTRGVTRADGHRVTGLGEASDEPATFFARASDN